MSVKGFRHVRHPHFERAGQVAEVGEGPDGVAHELEEEETEEAEEHPGHDREGSPDARQLAPNSQQHPQPGAEDRQQEGEEEQAVPAGELAGGQCVAPYGLYLGLADGLSIARVWTCRYSK